MTCVLVWGIAVPICAQPLHRENLISYFGGISFSDNYSSANIFAYDGAYQCGVFTHGSDGMPSYFAGIDWLLNGNWSLESKLEYANLSTNFSSSANPTQQSPLAYLNGQYVGIDRERYFNASLGMLSISEMLTYRLFSRFALSAGPFAGYFIRHSYSETENILSPSQAVYAENSLTSRTIESGNLSEVHTLQYGVQIGASYDIGFEPNLALRPSFNVMLPFTSVTNTTGRFEGAWRIFPVGASLSLVYRPPNEEQELPPQPALANWDSLLRVPTPAPTPEASKKHTMLKVSIAAFGVEDDGREIAEPVLSVERMHVTEVYPMLHYVFFDDGSAEIPARYHRETVQSKDQFNEKDLFTANALEIHHHVLDILGHRMRDNPGTAITLVGTRSEHSPGDSTLSDPISVARAESVARYLHDVWGIASDRMHLRSRRLPDAPSDDHNAFGEAENRRVEIVPSSPELTTPLWTERIERIATPPHISFNPEIVTSAGIESATILVKEGGRVLQSFNALTGGATGEYLWTLDDHSMPRRHDSLTYTFTVIDSTGDTARANGVIHLRQEQHDITKHESDTSLDKELERYSLILFDYSSSQLDKKQSDKIVEAMAHSINVSSQVTLTGHTDKTGDDAFNDRLAQQRVSRAAEMLSAELHQIGKDPPSMLVESHGSRDVLFDNSIPEGRVLSRTVRALIENDEK
ncbi:MAG TPA: OmpA family protein [Candidatus Kapabacteria bacterium]|nr:OmpA family protein [Candidatus Kapabacteria bacterium]